MNRLLRVAILRVVIPCAALTLAACASTQGTAYSPASGSSAPATGFERDQAYIAAVERTARMRGIDVRWVHPPVKRIAANDDGPQQE